MTSNLFIGVEGGATCSKGVLVNGEGIVLATAETEGTNHWIIGISTTARIIVELVDELLSIVNLKGSSVSSVGLALCGADTPNCISSLASALYDLRPNLISQGRKARVYNDAIAGLETATDQGGNNRL